MDDIKNKGLIGIALINLEGESQRDFIFDVYDKAIFKSKLKVVVELKNLLLNNPFEEIKLSDLESFERELEQRQDE